MATPYVAGLIACIISRDGNLLPAEMQNKVKATATQGKLSGLRKSNSSCLEMIINSYWII
jgi:cerevisin